jgi:hypothetical protein
MKYARGKQDMLTTFLFGNSIGTDYLTLVAGILK